MSGAPEIGESWKLQSVLASGASGVVLFRISRYARLIFTFGSVTMSPHSPGSEVLRLLRGRFVGSLTVEGVKGIDVFETIQAGSISDLKE